MAAALYSVVGTCEHPGIDPFAYLLEALPALFGLGESPAGALPCWVPHADWQLCQRQCAAGQAGISPELV